MKLENLFDFQKFAHNEKLDQMIRETEKRYGTELSDEDMDFVAAAGILYENQEARLRDLQDPNKD